MSLIGSCDRCWRESTLTSTSKNGHDIEVCNNCWKKYHSPKGIREEKLNKLLTPKKWYQIWKK